MDSRASYFLRQLPVVALASVALAGCSASGEPSGDRTFSDSDVPFTFRIPVDFTTESVDQFDSRGDVVAAAGIDKVDVVAVRRVAAGVTLPRGDVAHVVQGKAVTSRLHEVSAGGGRWAIECQWTADRRKKVLHACDEAFATVKRR